MKNEGWPFKAIWAFGEKTVLCRNKFSVRETIAVKKVTVLLLAEQTWFCPLCALCLGSILSKHLRRL